MKKKNKRTKASITKRLEYTREKNKGQNRQQIQKNWQQYRRFKFDKLNRQLKETDKQLYTEKRFDFIEYGQSSIKVRNVSKNYIEKSYRLNKSNYKEKFAILTDANFDDTRLLVVKYTCTFNDTDTDEEFKKTMIYSKVINSKTVGYFTDYNNLVNEIFSALEANIGGNYDIGGYPNDIKILWIRYKIYNQKNATTNKTKGAKKD